MKTSQILLDIMSHFDDIQFKTKISKANWRLDDIVASI